jgi:hypothetical protein
LPIEHKFSFHKRKRLGVNRIELVNESERTTAFIERHDQGKTALAFIDDQENERARIGFWPNNC